MKKFVCFMLMAVLVLACASFASAELSARYDAASGKIIVSTSGSGITRVNMNGSSTGYFVDGNNRTISLTPPAGATSVTISGSPDPAFGGDSNSVTVNIGGGSTPVTPTQAPVNPTQAPVNPTQVPVNPTAAPVNPGKAGISVSSYNNGTLVVYISGITDPAAIFVDGVGTGVAAFSAGSKPVKVGDLKPGTHTVTLQTFDGQFVSASFTVSDTPAVHDHVWGAWSTVKEATCTDRGERQRTCTICGETDKENVPSTGHRYKQSSEDSQYTYYRCWVCGATMKKAKIHYNTPEPAAPVATLAPASSTVMLNPNQYGSILWDASRVAVNYNAYNDPADPTTLVIEADLSNRAGMPTEIGLYLDNDLMGQFRNQGYTSVKYINDKAILTLSLANMNDNWFGDIPDLMYRVFSTDPATANGVLVKVEAELSDSSKVQPTYTLTGIILKGVTDTVISQNGVYDITR
jgi:hypothetical protein